MTAGPGQAQELPGLRVLRTHRGWTAKELVISRSLP